MDSVKHLMRRGLVKSVEKNGVSYETGPNAILLSDVSSQKGRFWNLAEFPVLHMMYRQGMVIPGHPGNTGRQPVLIGLKERTLSTLDYIHRGTYGLATKEELTEAGFQGPLLEDLWSLKLKFSGGHPKKPSELVSVIPLENGEAQLEGHVRIVRESSNIYRIHWGDESVQVDMNLGGDQDWSPPYVLPPRQIEDGYFSVVHLGEGNGWDPERPCMGSMVTHRGRNYLIDAGPGIGYSLESLGIDISEINGLFFTHAHDDHFAGLTSLIRGNRKVRIYATEEVYRSVRFKTAAILERDPDFLDHLVRFHPLKRDVWNDVDGLDVRPVLSPHPVETTVLFFRVLWEGGYRSYAHLADTVSLKILKSFVGDNGISEDFYKTVVDEYRKKVDVKKIDVGRGMIHGIAEDFADDPSPRLVLSHTEGPLSEREKEIGANATFGQVDILIPDRGDRLRQAADRLMGAWLDKMSVEDTSILLNGEILSLAPGTPLFRKGIIPGDLYLLLSGSVEFVGPGLPPAPRFAAGSLVGESEVLEHKPALGVYRTRGYVKVLRIPVDLYVHSLKKSGAIDERKKLEDLRRFLLRSRFPSYVVSRPRFDKLARSLRRTTWKAGMELESGRDEVYFLEEGGARQETRNLSLEVGDWFNARAVVPFLKNDSQEFWAFTSDSKGYTLSGEVIRSIPILCWTLAEKLDEQMVPIT